MSDIQVLSKAVKFIDEDGQSLITAPILDLYYLMSFAGDQPGMDKLNNMERMKVVANVVNAEYSSTLTWGQVAYLYGVLNDQLEEAKKNSTSTLESQAGME